MESYRFYGLIIAAVISITAFALLHKPSSSAPQREAAVEKREDARKEAQEKAIRRAEAAYKSIRLADYTALRKGMTYDEVSQIHGPGEEVGRKVEYYRELVTYRWKHQSFRDRGARSAHWMELTFADGKLSELKQEGLQ